MGSRKLKDKDSVIFTITNILQEQEAQEYLPGAGSDVREWGFLLSIREVEGDALTQNQSPQ